MFSALKWLFGVLVILVMFFLFMFWREQKEWNSPYHGITHARVDDFYSDAIEGVKSFNSFYVEESLLLDEIQQFKNIPLSLPWEENEFDKKIRTLVDPILPKFSWNKLYTSENSYKRDGDENIKAAYVARLFEVETDNEKVLEARTWLRKSIFTLSDSQKLKEKLKQEVGLSSVEIDIIFKKAEIHYLLNKFSMEAHNREYWENSIESRFSSRDLRNYIKKWDNYLKLNSKTSFADSMEIFDNIVFIWGASNELGGSQVRVSEDEYKLYQKELLKIEVGNTGAIERLMQKQLERIEEITGKNYID